MDLLTGTGLAASAGLNAYVPLVVLGLLDRYTQFVDLGPGFAWLSDGWVLGILAVLLAAEVVADKIPAVDSANDLLQTFVRPTAGGIVFGSSATSQIAGIGLGGQTATVTDPEAFFASHAWVPVLTGVVIALVVHVTKAVSRPAANTLTAGAAAPVVSTAEDVSALALSLVAVFLPLLVLGVLAAVAVLLYVLYRRLRGRRRPGAGGDRRDRAAQNPR
ncbi:hypothetical protein GCM10011374_09880 [Kocuria dechangensis]|uniref:DUF4126 domain-containing protein n=1 Tax=Kocuria dechangensis TaxID=1176249 RepID=A0A917LPE0_9MICC|nr:DUF4126 domain-containing protein [Kocuria dechangensis]GGG49417.1 hypothetical protein GCM10011374_09880 [Kocuria dechangensis]